MKTLQEQSDLGLHCFADAILSNFCVRNFRTFTVDDEHWLDLMDAQLVLDFSVYLSFFLNAILHVDFVFVEVLQAN